MKRSTEICQTAECARGQTQDISTNRQPNNMHLKAVAGLPDDGMFIHKVQDRQNTQCGAHAMRGEMVRLTSYNNECNYCGSTEGA